MSTVYNYSELAGRGGLALLFLLSGVHKLGDYVGTEGYMEAMGVPGGLLPLVVAVELVASIALIIGWQTRLSALALAGFTVLATMIFHKDFGDQAQMILLLKNIAVCGGLLVVFANGAGPISLDARRGS